MEEIRILVYHLLLKKYMVLIYRLLKKHMISIHHLLKKLMVLITSAVVREKVFIIRVRGGRELWGEQVSFAPGPQPM